MGCANAKDSTAQKDSKQSKPKSDNKKTSGDASLPKKEIKEGGIATSMFILDNKGKIIDFYDLDKKKLGEGSYGSVCKARHKSTKMRRAVKTISKAQMKNVERFKQEIAIMKMMDHPNIIKLYESFEDHRSIYLVMELCEGGELFDSIIESGHFKEAQAAGLMQQIVRAIFYMHENHICHRDLKPENFLFSAKQPLEKTLLKIIDFGLSCKFEIGDVLSTKAGTPYYVAPQVLSGKYDHMSDLWSCGVIMYVMLCGYPPFYGDTDAEVLSKVRLGNFSFNAADWKNVSEDAKNLIRHLLKMNPKDRYTAEQALNHEWIKDKAPKASNLTLQQGFVDNLRNFRSQNKLQKAALHIIAGQLNEEQIKALREIFTQLDGNGDGLLTAAEMKEGLKRSNLKDIPQDLAEILEGIDADGSGVIDYTEFLAATLDKRSFLKEEVCWSAFRVFDANGDGKISPEELKAVLGDEQVATVAGSSSVESILKELDGDSDGYIDFKEFMVMMRNLGEKQGGGASG